ncbi:MAG TPA: hypothetical protein VH641_12350 [Streptosporangiaceae bacterium]
MSQVCPAGCCPHPASEPAGECPPDLPTAALPERVIHLYTCQGLSTYRIGDISGIGRQRVTRILHRAGITVKPRGAGRPRLPRAPGSPVPDAVLADLYLAERLSSAEIEGLTGVPARSVRDRLRVYGVPMRTKGGFNREDRAAVPARLLRDLYLRRGLTAGEVGAVLGVSRRVVLRSAHDEGLPVRIGGPPPRAGPASIELIDALYADPQVRRAIARHGLPRVPPGGPLWDRFAIPFRITPELAEELYADCGLGLSQIELLTGQPSETVRKLLRAAGVALRPPGGRSPFLRRWRTRNSGG